MKRLNKKLVTLMLAGACVASIGVASTNIVASAAEATASAQTYKVDDVFYATATLGSQTIAEKETTAYTFANNQYMRIKRDLALKWYEAANTAKYLAMNFTFADLNFKTMTFEIESASSVATEDEKVSNAVEFSVEGGKVFVAVVHGEGDKKVVGAKTETTIAANTAVALTLTQDADNKFDEFSVLVNGADIGNFVQIGANYADYSIDKIEPLKITATTEGEAQTTLLLQELNGQKFDNVTKETSGDKTTYKVTDTAAPVLVVNEELSGFQYATVFNLNYEKIDVLKASSLTDTKKYYQYNPADTTFVADFDDKDTSYKTLTQNSTYFMDTVYYVNEATSEFSKTAKEGFTAKSVITEDANGNEYVSVKIKLGDGSKDMVYDLAWYANANGVAVPTLGGNTASSTPYIVVNQNAEGPTYANIKADDVNHTNVTTDWGTQLTDYQKLVEEAAKDKVSGSSEKLTIPAVDWLIKDNGGYRGMKFTISYKTPSGSTKTATRVSYSGLQLTIDEEGTYEFKVLAVDAAGNTMKYYVDEKLVDVTTSNIWNIDEIPSFEFTITNSDIKISEKSTSSSDRKVDKTLNQTYTLSGLKVVGAKGEKSAYALYRMDTTNYTGNEITNDALIGVSYEDIRTEANAKIATGAVGTTYANYFDLYLDIYAEKIATTIKGDKAAVKACFVRVEEYNSDITESNSEEWEKNNKYNWNATSKSFTAVEEGKYLIVGDFWEDGLFTKRAAAYKLVVVTDKTDSAPGDSKVGEWIKNNLVSVILFGVAGLMLIAILILLLVKPSDETLEDVEAKEAKKKEKKEKKQKSEKPKKEKKAKAEKSEEVPVEEAPVEETPVEEVPVEEVPTEETPVEETPVEEVPVEEVPTEETPVEEEKLDQE